MPQNNMNQNIKPPVVNVLINNVATPIQSSFVKLQEEKVLTISTQSGLSAVFKTAETFIDFRLPSHTSDIHQIEKMCIQMRVTAGYPAATGTATAYSLPATYCWINRVELLSNMEIFDIIQGQNIYTEKTFLKTEDLKNDSVLELFDSNNYGLASQFPGLYVVQTPTAVADSQSFDCFLVLRNTYLQSKGFLLPHVSSENTIRVYFRTYNNIKLSRNAATSLTLDSAQLIFSGVKYDDRELLDMLNNDYKQDYSCKTLTRRYNVAQLNFDSNNVSNNIDVSWLRGTFLSCMFYIALGNQVGEQYIQSQLYNGPNPNPGINGILGNVTPVEYASSLNYSLPFPINYQLVPETFAIKTFNFLDSSSLPVYVTNQSGQILRNSITSVNSEVDFQTYYPIYRFDFSDHAQEDYNNGNIAHGGRWIDGLYSLVIQSQNNLSSLPGSPKVYLIGCALQHSEVIIKADGKLKIDRNF